MSRAASLTLYFTVGDDPSWPMRLTNKTTGDPIDLAGATIECQVRRGYADEYSHILATATCTLDTDGTDGRFTVALDRDQTLAIGAGTFKYDVQTDIGGQRLTRLRGDIIGEQQVTA